MFLSYVEEIQEALDFENPEEIAESSDYYRNLICSWEDTKNDRTKNTVKEADVIHMKSASYREILEFCKRLEPIDEKWPLRLDRIQELLDHPDTVCQAEQNMRKETVDREYEYEHLAVYFVYRYFMKCRIDGDLYSRGCLAVFCMLLIQMLDVAKYFETGELSKEDRVQNAKDCSKEIEYSEDNLALLADLFWESGLEKIAGGL